MSSGTMDAALDTAARGWHVFPLRPGDKRPAVRDWEARATTDRARIERCWRTGAYNVGIACGPSRLVVIDLDTPKGGAVPPQAWQLDGVRTGLDVLAVLADRAGETLPVATYSVRTTSGGEHLYYAAPGGAEFRNTAGTLGWLVDTRAVGGYVVAAGSTVADRDYAVLDDSDAAPLPGWLAKLLTAPDRRPAPAGALDELLAAVRRRSGYAEAALRGELDTVLAAQPGNRNHTLNASAYALGRLIGA
ncbi:MAG: bifunctional DNA primase/polymerase, partial [Sciscionella sp.]